eukprot:gene4072-7361_t
MINVIIKLPNNKPKQRIESPPKIKTKEIVSIVQKYDFSWSKIGETLNADPFIVREMYYKLIENQDELSMSIQVSQNLGAFSNQEEKDDSDDELLENSNLSHSALVAAFENMTDLPDLDMIVTPDD